MIKSSLLIATFGVVLSSISSPGPRKSIFDFTKAYTKDSVCETDEGYSPVIPDLLNMKFDLSSLSGNEAMSMNQVLNSSNALETFLYCFSYDAYVPKSAFISTSKFREDEYNYKESFNEYNLRVVSRTEDGCLTKCLVEGLPNLSEEDRRYNVSMVHLNNPEKITSISFGIEFFFHTNEENVVEGTFAVREVVTITSGIIKDCFFTGRTNNKYNTGYSGTVNTKTSYEDNFYYFFNTDWKIDELVDVDIQYYQFPIFVPAWYRSFGYGYSYNNYIEDAKKFIENNPKWNSGYEFLYSNAELKKDFPDVGSKKGQIDKYTYTGLRKQTKTVKPGKTATYSSWNPGYWFANYTIKKYANMENIIDLRSYEFKDGDAFNFSEMKKNYEFGILVDQFQRTFYHGQGGSSLSDNVFTWGKDPFGIIAGTGIESTCITRLKFYKDGHLYNLGTVDIPRQTDENPLFGEPGMPVKTPKDPNWWEVIFAIAMGVAGVYVIYQLVSPLFKKKRGKKHA